MNIEGPGKLLSIYLDDSDHPAHDRLPLRSLYMAIVERARAEGLAGATVMHGVAGFGAHSRIHTANILTLSANLPIVIQIVDRAERIDHFLPILDEMMPEGLVTVQDVEIIAYRHRKPE